MKQKYLVIGMIFLLFPTIVLAETIDDSQIHQGYLDTPQINPDSDINLTDEQIKEQIKYLQNITGKTKKINSSNILFISGHSISISPGIEQNISHDADYYVIQFYSSLMDVDATTRDKIEEIDVVLLQYTQDNAFYAKIPKSAFETIDSLVVDRKIRYIGEIPYDAKIKQQLNEEVRANPDSEYGIVVYLFERPAISQLIMLKKEMDIHSYSGTTYFVYGTAEGRDIIEIADMDFVKLVEKQTTATISASGLRDTIFNIGENSNISIMLFAVAVASILLFFIRKNRKNQSQNI